MKRLLANATMILAMAAILAAAFFDSMRAKKLHPALAQPGQPIPWATDLMCPAGQVCIPAETPLLSYSEASSGLLRDASGKVFLICKGVLVREWKDSIPASSEELRRLKPCG